MTYQFVSERSVKYTVAIKHPSEVHNLVKRYAKEQELFIVLTLNGAHEVISIYYIASIGLANKTIVHPREVFRRAIVDNAVAIIIAHNHPSGSLEPSDEDKQITERICDAADIIGMHVLDHTIFSKTGYYSFKEHGLKLAGKEVGE